MSTASPFSKDSQHSPSVTQLWQPERFQTPLIDILNGAGKCRALQNPSSQEHICLRVCCPNGVHFLQEAKHWAFLSSKQILFFSIERGASHFFPITGGACPWAALPFTGSLCSEWSLGARIMQTTNPWDIKQWPGSMENVLCEWLAGKTHGYHVTGKSSHLFIYFLPSVTNSKNRPLRGSHNSREQDKFFKILIGEQLT